MPPVQNHPRHTGFASFTELAAVNHRLMGDAVGGSTDQAFVFDEQGVRHEREITSETRFSACDVGRAGRPGLSGVRTDTQTLCGSTLRETGLFRPLVNAFAQGASRISANSISDHISSDSLYTGMVFFLLLHLKPFINKKKKKKI